MSFLRQYSLIIGLFLMAVVAVILLTAPNIFLSKGAFFIDTELAEASQGQKYIRTKVDFGSAEDVNAFPRNFDNWQSFDYETDRMSKELGADAMLLRGYVQPGLYNPIFFLIMQGSDRSTFHPPPFCYQSLGYSIEEEGKEEVYLTNMGWVNGEGGSEVDSGSLSMKKLIVFRESDGKVIERRVVLYFYIRDNPLASNNVIMVRVEAIAPLEGSYAEALGIAKEFTSAAIPHLFEFKPEGYDPQQITAVRLVNAGLPGYLIIALMALVPISIVVYPRLGRASRQS